MVDKTTIPWADYTWNPWQGCKKISPGCKYCYMYRDMDRYKLDGNIIRRSADATFNKPLKMDKYKTVFTCSWSDFFLEQADAMRDDAWEIIRKTPHLVYLILTKRPENINARLPKFWKELNNVYLGVSIENSDQLPRWESLTRSVGTEKTFISFEPLLGPITLKDRFTLKNLPSWVIIGGESGNDHGKHVFRPCQTAWILPVMSYFQFFNVPVFIKQMGSEIAKLQHYNDRKGENPSEWHEAYRKREFPEFDYKDSNGTQSDLFG
jgi:protein gp37